MQLNQPFLQSHIRNFSVIAHIDHGKSTISDRLIQACGGLTDREMEAQVLDSMDLERERGITIKAQSVTLYTKSTTQEIYQLNLIDTPGHVDFSYEVSRSLSACEGALLIIDASQGVEAQTVANCHTAIEMGLTILPVLNKIDLPTAEPNQVLREIDEIIGISTENAILCSGKTGEGIQSLVQKIIEVVPPPLGRIDACLQALIIDAWFDNYLGVVALIRVKNGEIHKGDKLTVMSTGKTHTVERMGCFTPKRIDKSVLRCGEVGWVAFGVKDIRGAPVGDTLTLQKLPALQPLEGFQKSNPQVYASLFPVRSDQYDAFRVALEKLSLNDASLVYEPESSVALGFGFRCGFLGLLHMEIIQARLEREYQLDLIATGPSVVYEITLCGGETLKLDNPSQLPTSSNIQVIQEPISACHILVPKEYLGAMITLCTQRRGVQKSIIYHEKQVALTYHIPTSEVIVDFFDQIKSLSKGYASLDYNFDHFAPVDVVRLDTLVNGEKIDALAGFVTRKSAASKGRALVEQLKELLPRQQFDIAIQAAVGNQIVARATIKQYRKNVIGKCYGGDVTRKQKLLNKQKAGKKRMKTVGSIEIPQEAFMAILKTRS